MEETRQQIYCHKNGKAMAPFDYIVADFYLGLFLNSKQ